MAHRRSTRARWRTDSLGREGLHPRSRELALPLLADRPARRYRHRQTVRLRSSVIVIADNGPGFCNTSPAVYDSFRAGNSTDGTGLEPFCIRVKDFTADYLENGQAEMFTSNISYQSADDIAADTWRDYQLKVNEPLRLGDERIYLTGHGYAPEFTVTFPDGQTRTEALQFRPDDATTFLSSGALRFDPPGGTYATADERRRGQIAIEGLFAPTAQFNGNLLSSRFPELVDPAVAVDIYKGDTGLDTGIPQSIFSLDQEMINQAGWSSRTGSTCGPENRQPSPTAPSSGSTVPRNSRISRSDTTPRSGGSSCSRSR